MACSPPRPLRDELGDAEFAFVGTVAATSDDDHVATVGVESIWLGERLPERVLVRGRTDSDPRTFTDGERYLFVPVDRYTGPAQAFKDTACSATTRYSPAVARLEPDGAIGPRSEGGGAWLGVLVVLAAVGLWQARRARRRAAELDL